MVVFLPLSASSLTRLSFSHRLQKEQERIRKQDELRREKEVRWLGSSIVFVIMLWQWPALILFVHFILAVCLSHCLFYLLFASLVWPGVEETEGGGEQTKTLWAAKKSTGVYWIPLSSVFLSSLTSFLFVYVIFFSSGSLFFDSSLNSSVFLLFLSFSFSLFLHLHLKLFFFGLVTVLRHRNSWPFTFPYLDVSSFHSVSTCDIFPLCTYDSLI